MIAFEESSLEKLIIDSKKKYGSIFSMIVGEELFLFRLLTKKEYEIVIKSTAGDEDLKEEMVCQYAVLYPDVDFATYKAGIPTALAPAILYESGFVSADKAYQYLYESRVNVLDNFTEQAAIVIISAFPAYTFEDIEEWDIEKILLMAARAEWKLNVIDGNDFVFSREQEEEQEEQEEVDEKQLLKELEQKIIEQGGDPILQLHETVYKKERKFFDLPLIMGNNIHREDVVDAVRKSIHERISQQ